MPGNALIIFVRKPEVGKVKTRIAAAVGDEKALSIYKQLLLHTRDLALDVKADKYVYYSTDIEHNDIWQGNSFIKKTQNGSDLGERMYQAFDELLSDHDHVIVIGSDCFQLNGGIVNKAFDCLSMNDAVIGPAKDGGYYLLGMNRMLRSIFQNKVWSADSVFKDSIEDFRKEGVVYKTLVELSDVDTIEDVPLEYQ